MSELIEEKDAHGKVNYTLHLKTDGDYPVEVRIHFYALKSELRDIAYKNHKVKVTGSLQGRLYSHNSNNNIVREWLQLRGSYITLFDDVNEEAYFKYNSYNSDSEFKNIKYEKKCFIDFHFPTIFGGFWTE